MLYDVIFFINFIFFFNDTATTEIYTLSLHDALPISVTFPNVVTMLSFLAIFPSYKSVTAAIMNIKKAMILLVNELLITKNGMNNAIMILDIVSLFAKFTTSHPVS